MPIPAGTKFHGVAPSVDTTDRGSATVQVLRDAYTIEDFGNGTSTSTIELSSAQILALDTTFVEVVPAQGVGKAIEFVGGTMRLLFNSVPYDFPLNQQPIRLATNPGGSSQTYAQAYLEGETGVEGADAVMNATEDGIWLFNYKGNNRPLTPLVANTPLFIYATSPPATQNGNSSMEITVEYRIAE